ncbi:hypothetical protein NSQ26_05725 [Bacillus sp. FSL W7-1360]
MGNMATVIHLSEDIEEEVIIRINGVEFVTFVSFSPYVIEVNKKYPVEVSFFIDDTNVKESKASTKAMVRYGESFRYKINGYLNEDGVLDVGFLIKDDVFDDYQYLYGKYVSLEVDRINSSFEVVHS